MKEITTVEELKSWKLIKKFKELLADGISKSKRHPSELDPRRKLHYLDYAAGMIFTMFNPVLSSMRGLCAISHLKKVKDQVTTHSISLGSFSEAQNIFDPKILLDVLQKQAKKFKPDPKKKKSLPQAAFDLVAVDGSLFQTLSRALWANWVDDDHKAVKLHLAFSVFKDIPVDARTTAGNSCERKALLEMIQSGVMYVCDRYYGLDYSYFTEFITRGALFTIRIRNKPKITVIKEYDITEEDRKEGVISDQLVYLGDLDRNLDPVRLVKTGAYDTEILLVCSENPEKLSAATVSLIYRQRWQIEVFFKWLKSLLGCRKLLAESPNGVAIQLYSALLVAMILFEQFGANPTKREVELMKFLLLDYVTETELEEGLAFERSKNKSA